MINRRLKAKNDRPKNANTAIYSINSLIDFIASRYYSMADPQIEPSLRAQRSDPGANGANGDWIASSLRSSQ
jgi:hypothetical protein